MHRMIPTLAAAAMLLPAAFTQAQEISVLVHPDDSVHVLQGYAAEQVIASDSKEAESQDVARVTVNFPEQNPAVYELDSDEDVVFVVDGWLPEGADLLVQAKNLASGQMVDSFEHVIRGGDWLIKADYLNVLPKGENLISVTLRVPGRRDAVISHPYYVLEPRDLNDDEDAPWFEWEQDNDSNLGPYIPGEGFMTFNPPAGTQIIHVSATGSDSNSGLSPAAPLRTLKAAYGKIRDQSSDWILLKAGDTFEGSFGAWSKSGKSAESPIHIGVYGEGDRPIVRTEGDGFFRAYGAVSNIRIDGIHAYASDRLEPDGGMVWKEGGIYFYGKGKNFVVHDCKIEGFKFNLVFQGYTPGAVQNVVLYRNIIADSFGHWDGAVGGHSSGIYASGVTNLDVIECTFDHNGWNPKVSGATRTKFNHNMYVQDNCSNVSVRRSIISRGSSHGLQLRPGGNVTDNLFVRNAMAFFVAVEPSVITGNVIMQSDDMNNKEIRGMGFEVLPVESVLIANNIVTQKVGRAGWMPAINLTWERESMARIDSYDVEMRNNVIWNWRMDAPHSGIKVDKSARMQRSNNTIDGVNENGSRVVYRNPSVDFNGYVDGGLGEFLKNAVLRRRGEWNEKFTAPAFNAYMQDGFTAGGGGGSI